MRMTVVKYYPCVSQSFGELHQNTSNFGVVPKLLTFNGTHPICIRKKLKNTILQVWALSTLEIQDITTTRLLIPTYIHILFICLYLCSSSFVLFYRVNSFVTEHRWREIRYKFLIHLMRNLKESLYLYSVSKNVRNIFVEILILEN